MVNTILKEADLFCPNSVRINFTIYLNNTGLEEQGAIRNPLIDVLTFERGNPQSINHQGPQKYLAAETSMTVNKHWGVAKK